MTSLRRLGVPDLPMNHERLDLIILGPTSDARHPFPHAGYRVCLQRLLQGAREGAGVSVLTGAPGTGKSTLIRALAAHLTAEDHCVGQVPTPHLDREDLLRLVGFSFGLEARNLSRVGLLSELEYRLSVKCAGGKVPVLIIDEAHDLPEAVLEDLSGLGGAKGGQPPGLHIVLVGRDGPRGPLPHQSAIGGRTLTSCHLDPLPRAEMGPYAAYVLEGAGWCGEAALPAETLDLMHERTGGIPRLVNLVLGHLLIEGRLAGERALGRQDLESVFARLSQDHPEIRGGKGLGSTEQAIASSLPVPCAPRVSVTSGRVSPPDDGASARSRIPRACSPRRSLATWLWARAVAGRRWIPPALAVAFLAAVLTRLDVLDSGSERVLSQPGPVEGQGAGYTVVAEGWVGPPGSSRAGKAPEPLLAPLPLEGAEAPASDSGLAEAGQGTQDGEALLATAVALGVPDGVVPAATPAGAAGDAELVRTTEVARLLWKAERAFVANRLTLPADDNAYGHYQAVLTLDPGNPQANAGVQRVLARYRVLARQRLGKGDLGGARRMASRGLAVAPHDPELLAIKRKSTRVASRRNEPSDPPLLTRLEKWFRSGSSRGSHFLE